jgi:hypothetical protein
LIVVVALGEPGVPVTCWAKADPKHAMTVTVDNNSLQAWCAFTILSRLFLATATIDLRQL